jgi:hypothetical protein
MGKQGKPVIPITKKASDELGAESHETITDKINEGAIERGGREWKD